MGSIPVIAQFRHQTGRWGVMDSPMPIYSSDGRAIRAIAEHSSAQRRATITCFNAPPQGLKTRNQRAPLSFEEKGPKTAPLGPFGSLWV